MMSDKRQLHDLIIELHRQWHKHNQSYRAFEKLRQTAMTSEEERRAEDGMLVGLSAMNAINAALQNAALPTFKESEN